MRAGRRHEAKSPATGLLSQGQAHLKLSVSIIRSALTQKKKVRVQSRWRVPPDGTVDVLSADVRGGDEDTGAGATCAICSG